MTSDNIYLEQSYKENWELYNESLLGRTSTPAWDICIITASNNDQAKAYNLQIKRRLQAGLLPKATRFLSIPDLNGKRIGSGGATLNALLKSSKLFGNVDGCGSRNLFEEKRILIIHSGGDSKRIPQYSAFGKLFSRVPRSLPDGRPSTLFDEFYISLSGIPSQMKEGVLIVSGDVLLLFNNNQLDFGRQGVIGVTSKVPATVGANHGVYVENPGSGRVKQFLHKAPVAKLHANHAIDEQGNVNLDTGIVWLDSEVADNLLNLVYDENEEIMQKKIERMINDKVRLNFYGDFLFPLTEEATLEQYLAEESEGKLNSKLAEIRKEIWDKLNNIPLYVQSLSPAEFIHFGTSKEFRDLMTTKLSDFSGLGWQQNTLGYSESQRDITLINSCLERFILADNNVLIEDSHLMSSAVIGEGTILSNVISGTYIKLRDNLVLHQLPVNVDGTSYVTRLYGVKDNPKQDTSSGTFCNVSWSEWLEKLPSVSELSIWGNIPVSERTLWNAKLFPVCADRDKSLELVLWLQDPINVDQSVIEQWLSTNRVSLLDCTALTNRLRILEDQAEIEDLIRRKTFLRFIIEEKDIDTCSGILGADPMMLVKRLSKIIPEISNSDDPSFRIRGYRVVAEIIKTNKLEWFTDTQVAVTTEILEDQLSWSSLEDKAFTELSSSIQAVSLGDLSDNSWVEFKHKYVRVCAAARADLAGGWSDTPPYSMEKGGTVLNCAINLNGQLPIEVTARVLSEPRLILCSHDLNVRREVGNTDYILDYDDPSDPLALHKTALVLTGIVPRVANRQISGLFGTRNLGLELSTNVSIPKGSGLGTSSILAGAMIKCLSELQGNVLSEQQLFDQVLTLEQMLTTGGGWQDQVGGLVGGIKLVSSKPGLTQSPTYTSIELDASIRVKLEQQFVIIYTGQRRLAKRILRDIMGGYILRDKTVVESLHEIQEIALVMKDALESGNLALAGELMNKHWSINKTMDPGSTNAFVDSIFDVCSPFMHGAKLCGAGGGGFMELIAKDAESVELIRATLIKDFPDSQVRVWDSKIVKQSLTVETKPFE